MFIGHFAPALAAAVHPKTPRLGLLFIAAQLPDIAFFTFMPLGVEAMRIDPGHTVMNPFDLFQMPLTHSMLGMLCWAVLFGLLMWGVTGHRVAAWISGAVVMSHWVLDVLVHAPDMTLAGGPPNLGLGLWNYPWVEVPLELGLVGVSSWFLARRIGWTRPLLNLLGVMFVLQLVNWLGPQPSRADASVWLMALTAFALIIAQAWRVERRRRFG